MCYTIIVYGRLSQFRWVLLWIEYRLFEEFPRHGYSWLVGNFISFSCHSGLTGCHCSPVGVLETHDDGQRDGFVLTGQSRRWGNRNPGDDGLCVVRGVDWGRNFLRYRYTCVAGEWSMGILLGFRAGILERKTRVVHFYLFQSQCRLVSMIEENESR